MDQPSSDDEDTIQLPESPYGSQMSLVISFKEAVKVLYRVGRYSLLAIIVASVIAAVGPALQVLGIASLINGIAHAQHSFPTMAYVGLAELGIAYLISNQVALLIQYLGNRLTHQISYEADLGIVEKLTAFEVQDFEKAETYDKVKRVDGAVGTYIYGLFNSVRSSVQALLSVVGVVAVIASWNVWIAILLLITPIPGVVVAAKIQAMQYQIQYSRAPQQRVADYFRSLLTSDASRKEVKIFSLESIFKSSFLNLRKLFLQQDLSVVKAQSTKSAPWAAFIVAIEIFSIGMAAYIALGSARVGELAGFISATGQMSSLVEAAYMGVAMIFQYLLYVSNWVNVMQTEPSSIREGTRDFAETLPDVQQASPSEGSRAVSVEFQNVTFIYPGTDRTVLQDVSFKIDAGTTAALVGINGSGKTTICKLLLRFYEPTSGRILVNGADITEFSRASLYQHFSALFQDFTKYERSLGDNVTYGMGQGFDPAQNTDAVKHDLELVGLDFLPGNLPEGYETILGRQFEGGQQLSIGQWQRLATARALYKKPKLLVLDEPTASVDAVSEAAMFEALGTIDYDLTMILVAHRFTTISHAKHIIVLNEGKVVGAGTHEELMRSCHFYADICKAQAGYQ